MVAVVWAQVVSHTSRGLGLDVCWGVGVLRGLKVGLEGSGHLGLGFRVWGLECKALKGMLCLNLKPSQTPESLQSTTSTNKYRAETLNPTIPL